MFNPQSGNNEFIEIYNRSETQSFDLSNYKIIYYTSNADLITSAGFGLILPPKSYAVILEGDYDFATGIYNSIIHANALKLKISDNSFGTSGMANTSNRPVWFVNATNDTLDRHSYTANNGTGYSDEKIIVNRDSLATNWANSLITNGTPGFKNSVTPLNYDLKIKSLTISPSVPIQGDDVQIFSSISNSGILAASAYTIEIFNDANFDSTGSISEVIYSQTFSNLSPNDSITVNTALASIAAGNYHVISKVTADLDEDTSNNKKILRFTAYPPGNNYNDLVINEIMYAPLTNEPEWVELYNRNAEPINLKKWKLGDNSILTNITSNDAFIQPLSFVVLSKDSSIINFFQKVSNLIVFNLPALNNTGDAVVLKDSLSVLMDSLSYSPDWGGNVNGKSLERISVNNTSTNKTNWGASQSIYKATPGYVNSITIKDNDLRITSFKNKKDFSIIGEQAEFEIKIQNKGLNSYANYLVNIFNDVNKDSIPQSSEFIGQVMGSFLASGDSSQLDFSTTNFVQGKNYFIAKLEVVSDDDTTNNFSFTNFSGVIVNEIRNDIVINEIMYAPNSPEPEWIEIYNRSSKIIDIKNYKIADNSDTVFVIKNTTILNPGEYFIVTSDTTLKRYYNILSSFISAPIPSLNNSGDKIIILDSLNRTIDSLQYFASWGGSTGKSLERISVEHFSTDSSNWKTSASKYRATPGYVNSLTPKDNDLMLPSFTMKKDFALIGEQATFEIKILNKGLTASQYFLVNIFNDANKDSIPQSSEMIGQANGTSLASNDSTLLEFSTTKFVQGENYFIAKLEATPDDDTTNNISFTNFVGVVVNEIRNDIVINEIMFAPNSPEPEWIEIFNRSNKVIDFKNYKIADNSDTVTVINKPTILNPGEYFIIASDTTLNKYYNVLSPFISAAIPSLNNSGDKIIILDSLNRTIDSLHYFASWGGSTGKSLERIDVEHFSTDSSNWQTSQSKYKATPGYINSISLKSFDIQVTNIVFNPSLPFFADSVVISAKVKNKGMNAASFNLKLWEDTNLDSLPNILISSLDGINLLPGDSTNVQFSFTLNNLQSEKGLLAVADFIQDQDTSNNYFYKKITPGYPPNTILINEILYSPINGEPEWIEIFNNSNDSINLKNWSVTDVLTTPVTAKINDEFYLKEKSFLVLAKDTTLQFYHRLVPSKVIKINLPVLNNDVDGVVLKDNRGVTIDSVKFSSELGGTGGKSLERISLAVPSNLFGNWGSSTDIELSTPGRINSITPKQFDLSIAEISFNPRFPVSGENVLINAKVKNNASSSANNFSVEFWTDSDSNQIVDQLLSRIDGLSMTASDSSVISSTLPILNLNSKILTAVKIIFSADEDTLNNYAEKSVEPGFPERSIIINEVMYEPINGEPEWIELVNISDKTIDIKDWSVSDILTTPTKIFITNSTEEIQPGEYFVLARDTSFYNFHSPANYKVNLINFGTLGNTEDGIVVYDFRNGIIDSFFYKSSWGGKNGYSLERISLTQPTNDSSNWITSLSVNRSTPGLVNSIFNIPSYEKNELVINEIMFDPDIDNSEFIEFLNLSSDSINVGGWQVEDENQNISKLSVTSLLLPTNQYFLLIADSLTINKYNLQSYPYKSVLDETSLGLINTGELILLKDTRGNTIDSVWYSDKWHNKNFVNTNNISLERINPHLNGNDTKNWSSSVSSNGASPAMQNSIFTDNQNRSNNISVSPNPFSPDNDGFEDFTIINYTLGQQTSQVRIKIFDSKGRLVRTLSNNQPSGSTGSLVFDGIGDDGTALRIGIYIIFLEALNETEGVVETLKTTVVVARKL
jgi:hypothetical protein